MGVHRGNPIITDSLIFALDGESIRHNQPAQISNMVDGVQVPIFGTGVTRNENYFRFTASGGLEDSNFSFSPGPVSAEVMFKSTALSQKSFVGLMSMDVVSKGFGQVTMAGDTSSNYLRFGFWGTTAAGNVEVYNAAYNSDLEGSDGNWVHYLGTYDGANLYLYRQGIEIATLASTDTPETGVNGIGVGMRPATNVYELNGDIGIARLWNRGLTPAEAKYQFDIANARFNIL